MFKFIIFAVIIAVAHAQIGGYQPTPINDEVRALANWAAAGFEESEHTVVAISNYRTQIVSGVNHKFTLELIVDGKTTKTCEMSIFTQAWTNTRKHFEAPICSATGVRSVGGFVPTPVNDEVKDLANWAAAGFEGSQHAVVSISNYRTQIVSGVNHKFTLELLVNGKESKSCEMSIFTQAWTNTRRFFEAPVCSASRAGSFQPGQVTDKIKELASWSARTLSMSTETSFGDVHTVMEIKDVSTQIVSGMNYKFTLVMLVNGKQTKTCQMSVYEQEWTNTRQFFAEPVCSTTTNDIAGGFTATEVNAEVQELAKWAAASWTGSMHTVVAIKNYRTQVVAGVNHKFTLELVDNNQVVKSCEMDIFVQSWTNTRKFNSEPVCTASRAVGGFVNIEVSEKVKEIASWSASAMTNQTNHTFIAISNVQRQIVNGINYKFTLTLNVEGKAMKVCEMSVFDQEWTGARYFFEEPRCTAARSLVGGFTEQAVVSAEAMEVAQWAASTMSKMANNEFQLGSGHVGNIQHSVMKIENLRTQIVNGVNYKFTMKVSVSHPPSMAILMKSCEMDIFVQPWTNTRKFNTMPVCGGQ